jgi:GH24 family phage-related lysozyme (muramidase)
VNISQVGLNLIKSFEGCRLTAYKVTSSEKYYTIGYGHYGSDVRAGQTINQQQADALLMQDVQRFVKGVNDCVQVSLTQYQFDSLVSLCYNIGVGAFQQSTLVTALNKQDYSGAASQFLLWVHSGGKVLQGLITRRKAEMNLFLKTDSPPAQPIEKPQTTLSSYTVESGDNLTYIAKKFGVSLQHILDLNPNITNPDLIRKGQVIRLQGEAVPPQTQNYTVRSGEVLSVIAKRFHTSIDKIMNLNPQIHNKNLIYAGQVIKVPKL